MDKNKIIEEMASAHLVERYINGFHPDNELRKELAQEVYLILLEYDSKTIIEAYENGMLNFLMFRIAKNLIFSSTSSFYYKYIRHENNKVPIELCEGKLLSD